MGIAVKRLCTGFHFGLLFSALCSNLNTVASGLYCSTAPPLFIELHKITLFSPLSNKVTHCVTFYPKRYFDNAA